MLSLIFSIEQSLLMSDHRPSSLILLGELGIVIVLRPIQPHPLRERGRILSLRESVPLALCKRCVCGTRPDMPSDGKPKYFANSSLFA